MSRARLERLSRVILTLISNTKCGCSIVCGLPICSAYPNDCRHKKYFGRSQRRFSIVSSPNLKLCHPERCTRERSDRGRAEGPMYLARIPFGGEIIPCGIRAHDQLDLFHPSPSLKLFLASNCGVHILELLPIDQTVDSIGAGKPFECFCFVLKTRRCSLLIISI